MGRFLVMRFPLGRLGNQMFNYALARQYADEFGYELVLEADWLGTRLFEGLDGARVFTLAEYTRFNQNCVFSDITFAENPIWKSDGRGGGAYVRCDDTMITHRYSGLFRPDVVAMYSREHLRQIFALREDIKRTEGYKRLEDQQGTYDVAHIRRGELLRPGYRGALSVISMKSYRRAFRLFGVDVAQLRVCTDGARDPSTNRPLDGPSHIDPELRINLPPASFAKEIALLADLPCSPWRDLHPGEYRFPHPHRAMGPEEFAGFLWDILTMLFCRRLFRGNSSLGWWIGCLSRTCQVYAPLLTEEHVDRREELPLEVRNRGNGRVIDVDFVEGNHPSFYTLPQLIEKEYRTQP